MPTKAEQAKAAKAAEVELPEQISPELELEADAVEAPAFGESAQSTIDALEARVAELEARAKTPGMKPAESFRVTKRGDYLAQSAQ